MSDEMIERADAGDIIDQETVVIGFMETVGDVMDRMVPAAVRVLLRQIDALKAGDAPRTPQDEAAASYFGRRTPGDGEICWGLPARDIVNLVRAVAPPYPGAFTLQAGIRLMIRSARVVPGSGMPGQKLSVDPVVVAGAENAAEQLQFNFVGGTNPETKDYFMIGEILGAGRFSERPGP